MPKQDRRIVWRWGFVGPQSTEGPTFDSLLTVTLDGKSDGGTALPSYTSVWTSWRRRCRADGVAPGWESALGKLAEVAARSSWWSSG